MGNLNTGKVISFDQIPDYNQAAKDFSEGDSSLEELLSNCFDQGIKTVACCAGHKEKDSKPYIAFSFSIENEQYLCAIMDKLKDCGYTFRYNKLYDGKSFFQIQESDGYDFSNPSSMFEKINEIIKSMDKNRDYYEDLPRYLQKYFSIAKNAEADELLETKGMSDCFQFCYEKIGEEYQYTMFTNDLYYTDMAAQAGFAKKTEDGTVSYQLKTENRDQVEKSLKIVESSTLVFLPKKVEEKKVDLPTGSKTEKLDFELQYDERTKNNPTINRIRVDLGENIQSVAKKLISAREKGLSAFAIFNEIELNNYDTTTVEEILNHYNQTREKLKNQNHQKSEESYQHFIKMRNQQRREDQLERQQRLAQLVETEIQELGGIKK